MQTAQPRAPMGQLWSSIQSWLFPMLEDEIGELDETHYGGKIAGHISRDATAIHAREKAGAKPKPPPKPRRGRRGRRRKDDPPAPPPDPTRLQRQLERDLKANLADLPRACD